MAKKDRSPKKKKADRKKRTFMGWLRRLLWRSLALALVILVLAFVIAPERVLRVALGTALESQGLVPYAFDIADVSTDSLQIQNIRIGDDDLRVADLKIHYRLPGAFLGRFGKIELTDALLQGRMVSDEDGTRPTFGVVDRYLTPTERQGVSGGPLADTDVVIRNGRIVLKTGSEADLVAAIDADLGGDGRMDVDITIDQPDADLSSFTSRAKINVDADGVIDATASLDVTSFALFEWGLEDANLDLTFKGTPADGDGVVRVDVDKASLDGRIFERVLPGAGNADLRESLKDLSAKGEVRLGRDADGFTVFFDEPLRVISTDEEVNVLVHNTDTDIPAFHLLNESPWILSSAVRIGQSGAGMLRGALMLDGQFTRREDNLFYYAKGDACSALMTNRMEIASFLFQDTILDFCPDAEQEILNIALDGNRPTAITLKTVLQSDQLIFQFPQNDFTLKGDWPNAFMTLTYDVPTADWNVQSRSVGGNLLLNADIARLDEIDLTLDIDGLGSTIEDMNGTLVHMRIQNTEELPLYAPMHVDGEMVSKDGIATLSGHVRDDEGRHISTYEGEQNWRTYKGYLTYETGELAFNIGARQPQNMFPVLKELLSDATGRMEASGIIDWRGDGTTSNGTLALRDIDFASLVGPVSGVNSKIALGSLLPLATKKPQNITVDAIDIGLDLLFGDISFSLGSDGSLILENATWPWAGGEIGIKRTPIALGGEPQELSIYARDVQLEEVFFMLDVDGLLGTGVLSGELPAVIENGGATITNGLLQSSPEGGTLQYIGAAAEAAGQQAEGSELMFSALENFQFEALEVAINGQTTDILEVNIRLEGWNQEVLDGYPMKFNINTEGPLMEMIRKGTVGYRIPERVKQRMQ